MTNNRITNKKLSIVITFCNEGREVKETIESLRVSSDENLVDILLVNDASDDKYDYNHIASKYNASIYTNKKRKGVAESRNIGVSLSRTPYIIILDAHMRIYQTDWADIILHLLSMYPRTLFCCQTLPINKVGEIISSTPTSFGAYIDMQTMGAKWNKVDLSLKDYIYDIPCLLGASYAFSRNYWLEIHGCDGLKSYGYDEQLISLKSWLYGEGCSLIKTISFGHMFRDKTDVPYSLSELDYTYNKLLLICLFLGKNEALSFSKKEKLPSNILYEVYKYVSDNKTWLDKIFTADNKAKFYQINNKVIQLNEIAEAEKLRVGIF